MKTKTSFLALVWIIILPLWVRGEIDLSKFVQIAVTTADKSEETELKGKVAVTGAVSAPQPIEFKPGLSILDAVEAAGGFQQLALRNEFIITNPKAGTRISYRGLPRSGEAWREYYSRVLLREGDVLYVREIYL